jgi:hypothetical protein
MKRATAREQRAALAFSTNENVRIERVAFPDIPHHARFINVTGYVVRVIKTRGVVEVKTPIGKRECLPQNITKETHQ